MYKERQENKRRTEDGFLLVCDAAKSGVHVPKQGGQKSENYRSEKPKLDVKNFIPDSKCQGKENYSKRTWRQRSTHYRRRKWTKVRVFILTEVAPRVHTYRRLERATGMVYMAASGSHSPHWLTPLCCNVCAPTELTLH